MCFRITINLDWSSSHAQASNRTKDPLVSLDTQTSNALNLKFAVLAVARRRLSSLILKGLKAEHKNQTSFFVGQARSELRTALKPHCLAPTMAAGYDRCLAVLRGRTESSQ